MATSKEKKVHDVFEKISGNYDKMNSVISFNQHQKWRKDMMQRMSVQEGATALDVCCGTADWTISLAQAAGPTGKVKGLDFSESMLAVGKEKVKDIPTITLIQGNAMKLPFDDNSFDFATIGFGLRNVPDYDTVIREMYRVLKPGGMIACLETSQPELPIYRQLFRFYFKLIMPALGKLFAKSYQEYSWLQQSADDFPGRKQLAQMFTNAGFVNVAYKSYSGGATAGHIGYK